MPIAPFRRPTLDYVPAWVLPGASLDMDFAGNRYWLNGQNTEAVAEFITASGATFTRGSTALSWDTLNNVSSFGSNVARVTNLGFWPEDSKVNLVATYNNLTAAGWGQFTTSTGTVSRTAASGTAPDGTNTATLITVNRSVSTDQAQVNFGYTGTAENYSGQFWLKANGAGDIGKSVDVNLYNGAGTHHIVTVTLTANWVQFKNENKTQAANASNQLQVGYCGSGNGGTAQTGQVQFLAWGAQAEVGTACSSLIPTAGASATRAADVFQLGAGCVSLLSASAVWIYMAGTYARATINKDAIPISSQTGAGDINPFYIQYSTQKASDWNGSADLATANTTSQGSTVKIATTGNSSSRLICLNGGTVATDAGNFNNASPTNMYLGSDQGTNYWWNGPITRFAIGQSLLTSAQIQALTT